MRKHGFLVKKHQKCVSFLDRLHRRLGAFHVPSILYIESPTVILPLGHMTFFKKGITEIPRKMGYPTQFIKNYLQNATSKKKFISLHGDPCVEVPQIGIHFPNFSDTA